jgi:hypothetical protein
MVGLSAALHQSRFCARNGLPTLFGVIETAFSHATRDHNGPIWQTTAAWVPSRRSQSNAVGILEDFARLVVASLEDPNGSQAIRVVVGCGIEARVAPNGDHGPVRKERATSAEAVCDTIQRQVFARPPIEPLDPAWMHFASC